MTSIITALIFALSLNYANADTIYAPDAPTGSAIATGATYPDTRGQLDGAGGIATSNMRVGQSISGGFTLYRSFTLFVIPEMTTCSACTLYVDGQSDASTTDFEVYVVAGTQGSTIESTDFPAVDGWATGGNLYTGSVMNDTWNSSSYSAGWNAIVFNAAGRDSIVAAQGDTLFVALISKEDYVSSQPGGDEYLLFSDPNPPNEGAFLSITYSSGWSGNLMGVTNPDVIFGLPKASVASVMGVE